MKLRTTLILSLVSILGVFLILAGFKLVTPTAKALATPTVPVKAAGAFVAHCYCKAIIYAGDDVGKSIPNPIVDYGQIAAYNTQFGHNKNCEDKCSATAAADTARFMNDTWLCQTLGCRKVKTRISAYSAVGTVNNYRVAQSNFFQCTGGDTTCTCPSGWLSSTSNADGGITADGKCKKHVCGPFNVNPIPPNGTSVGTWGFTWGDGLWAWGTTANGGAANCNTTPCVAVPGI